MQLLSFTADARAVHVSVPSTGRSGLQPERTALLTRQAQVSVPSTGRSGLQQCSASQALQRCTVSVPSTGRSGLQPHGNFHQNEPFWVSVPSTGRSGLQRAMCVWRHTSNERFQYPLRVEVGCNHNVCPGAAHHSRVSVPSTGRSGLQPQACLARQGLVCVSVPSTGRSGLQQVSQAILRRAPKCFSTLYGSKWVATRKT